MLQRMLGPAPSTRIHCATADGDEGKEDGLELGDISFVRTKKISSSTKVRTKQVMCNSLTAGPTRWHCLIFTYYKEDFELYVFVLVLVSQVFPCAKSEIS
jgi:hypothetical protein